MPTSSIRVLVLGNSGSGKSTYAARRAAQAGVELLELDTIVWGLPRPKDDPLPIGVPRPIERVHADLAAFLARHPAWVIEGCDGDLVERALPACTELVFLNPGVEVCLANNRARPWEPHKFDRAEEQEQMLPALLEWVEAYTTRTDPKSYVFHRRIFDGHAGVKREVRDLRELDAP